MSPSRTDDDDPITAEYDVYLTPHQTEQLLLLQYPNRARARPYNARHGAAPSALRLKPASGHLELDIHLNTAHNFNRFAGLKWGDAVATAREVHNDTATFGVAAGFSGAKPRAVMGRARGLRDQADREGHLAMGLQNFAGREEEGGVMHRQTLGGQVVRHGEGEEEVGKPVYFLGAFRGGELHLSRVDGTVQMRPQFHHLDAEEQRGKLAASRAAAGGMEGGAGAGGAGEAGRQGDPRAVMMKNKSVEEAERDRAEDRMRRVLQASEAETWVEMEYVDEDQEEAYGMFEERMFVQETAGAAKLVSGLDGEGYLDAISMPRRESPTRRRKRKPRRRASEMEVESEEDDGAGGGGAAVSAEGAAAAGADAAGGDAQPAGQGGAGPGGIGEIGKTD